MNSTGTASAASGSATTESTIILSSTTPPTSTDQHESTSPSSSSTESLATGSPEPESHVAAIGGGVGGGVGGVLTLGIVGYLIHRKRKQRRDKVP
jgi:hypothetical protein